MSEYKLFLSKEGNAKPWKVNVILGYANTSFCIEGIISNHSTKLAVVKFHLEFGGQDWIFKAKADVDKSETAHKRIIKITGFKSMVYDKRLALLFYLFFF